MRTIRVGLDEQSIQNAISQLESYRAGIGRKSTMMLERLGSIGVNTANMNKGVYGQYIVSEKNLVEFKSGTSKRINVIIRQTGYVTVKWLNSAGEQSAKVSPLMMAEYGSGQYALPGHRGTFPGQRHAFQNYWTWKDLDGVEHQSSGFVPTRPGFKASIEIRNNAQRVAREVFSIG